MGLFKKKGAIPKLTRLAFELTTACDHRCAHCYNIWERKGDSPALPEPGLQAYLAMMEHALSSSGARQVTITGGEPLLREGAMEIIGRACLIADSVQVVTNGGHVSRATAAALRQAGVGSVQLTFLAGRAQLHDRLKGKPGSFEETVAAALDLRDEGVVTQACFVALRDNGGEMSEVLELCLALGIRSVVYNRACLTGGSKRRLARLLPSVEQIEEDLRTANQLGRALEIRVTTAMPIPPCLVHLEHYPWVRFGFCSTGSATPNLVVDPRGDVRSCNLSGVVLGNVQRHGWKKILRARHFKHFKDALPQVCRGCTHQETCAGGCKESALALFHSLDEPEPLLRMAMDPNWPGPEEES